MDARTVLGDIHQVLSSEPANSFDGCLTDPPYGLKFMGKDWDHGIPSSETWREVLRVLKPGAFLLAFGGTRTHHRLMVAIEDAGFELRDCLMWIFGSGFPKGLDIGKALDKQAGAQRKIVGPRVYADGTPGHFANSDKYAQDSCTRGKQMGETKLDSLPATDAAKLWNGYNVALKPAWEPIILAMKPIEGTFAQNVLKWGTGGLAVDACRIPVSDAQYQRNCSGDRGHDENRTRQMDFAMTGGSSSDGGRWPANLLLNEEAAVQLDEQTGVLTSRPWDGKRNTPKTKNVLGDYESRQEQAKPGDSGGASRFFYCSKSSPSERGKGNNHPCCKPIRLCSYLARLILPPTSPTHDCRLLIPFCGSGSEMLGAWEAGWDSCLGIDNHQPYLDIAARRLDAKLTEALG
jgi:site-specific DNA-methyltransferase (adenine-specific)